METPTTLWIHKEVLTNVEAPKKDFSIAIEKKLQWSLLQLATDRRTPTVKGIGHHASSWRRSPLRGFGHYLWWIPVNSRGVEEIRRQPQVKDGDILVRAIRHHDQNSTELPLGQLEEYLHVDLPDLRPLYDEQQDVAFANTKENVDVRVVKGQPGSGKTVALHYATAELARASDPRTKVLYLTYTARLAREAKKFFEAFQIHDRVHVATLDDILESLAKHSVDNQAYHLSKQQQAFVARLSARNQKDLGPWANFPGELWEEIRAYLFGMALPYPLERNGFQSGFLESKVMEYPAYSELRSDLDDAATNIAYREACRLLKCENDMLSFFGDQYLARQVLDDLLRGECLYSEPLAAVVVDEVQDLTVVQMAMLLELGKLRNEIEGRFTYILAGDESQTVIPSGFDWGVTNDLFGERLATNPKPYKLSKQRRSPKKIFEVMTDTWQLYHNYLAERRHIPRNGKTSGLEDYTEDGTVIRWKLDGAGVLPDLFREIKDYTDLAIVDCDETLLPQMVELCSDCRSIADRVIYRPADIKGLDRRTVIVFGVGNALRKLDANKEALTKQHNPLKMLVNRAIIDDLRVALSRSTDILILADSGELSPDFKLDGIWPSSWSEVQSFLRRTYQEVDSLERIHDLLRQGDESLDQEDWRRAELQNREALELLIAAPDDDLGKQADLLQLRIREAKGEYYIRCARASLEQTAVEEAINHFKEADNLISPDERGRLRHQLTVLDSDIHLLQNVQSVEHSLQAKEYPAAYLVFLKQIDEQSAGSSIRAIAERARRLRQRIGSLQNEISIACLQKAHTDFKVHKHKDAVRYYRIAALSESERGQPNNAACLACVADRYQNLPTPVNDPDQLVELVLYCERYTELLIESRQTEARHYLVPLLDWLVEAINMLTENPEWYSEVGIPLRRLLRQDELRIWERKEFTPPIHRMLSQCLRLLRERGRLDDAMDLKKVFIRYIDGDLNIDRELTNIARPLEFVEQVRRRLGSLNTEQQQRFLLRIQEERARPRVRAPHDEIDRIIKQMQQFTEDEKETLLEGLR